MNCWTEYNGNGNMNMIVGVGRCTGTSLSTNTSVFLCFFQLLFTYEDPTPLFRHVPQCTFFVCFWTWLSLIVSKKRLHAPFQSGTLKKAVSWKKGRGSNKRYDEKKTREHGVKLKKKKTRKEKWA